MFPTVPGTQHTPSVSLFLIPHPAYSHHVPGAMVFFLLNFSTPAFLPMTHHFSSWCLTFLPPGLVQGSPAKSLSFSHCVTRKVFQYWAVTSAASRFLVCRNSCCLRTQHWGSLALIVEEGRGSADIHHLPALPARLLSASTGV